MARPPDRLRSLRPPGAPDAGTPAPPAGASPAPPWSARTAGGVQKPTFMPNLAAAGRKPKKESEAGEGGAAAPTAAGAHEPGVTHGPASFAKTQRQEKSPRTGAGEKQEKRRSAPAGSTELSSRAEGLFSAGPPTTSNRSTHHFTAVQRPRMKAKVEEVENVDAMNVTHPVMLPFRAPHDDQWDIPPQELLAHPPAQSPLFFMQLPAVLPVNHPPAPNNPAAGATQNAAAALGSGHIGKLTVYQSGRMQLVMGDVVFDVAPGLKPSFLQQLAVITTPPPPAPAVPIPNAAQAAAVPLPAAAPAAPAAPAAQAPEGHMHSLGAVHHRLVCVPSVSSCLRPTS